MWIIIGFAGLGLLIGNLIALTSESVVSSVISLLFAFLGGSILVFLHRLNEADRKVAGGSVLTLSVFCLMGIYGGIWVSQHRALSPVRATGKDSSAKVSEEYERYLRSNQMTEWALIDRNKESNVITPEEAYKQMRDLAKKNQEQSGGQNENPR